MKTIVTTKRVTVIIMCVYVTIMSSQAPVYLVNRLAMKFFPDINKSLITLVRTEDRDYVEGISYIINNTILPFCAFVLVAACTTILVLQLQKSTAWRKNSTQCTKVDGISIRNQKAAKMVAVISVTFIVCFVPICIIFLVMSLRPELTISSKYKDILLMIGAAGLFLESINASVNIFIYYHMSSRYRAIFREMFSMLTTKKKK